ncbi:competence protein ComK [Sporosarcina pasteurii]|uniref:Genetic competence transcription factor n=1 Tax=Sporosarcina pasteurii TaxID=1474 RepID=A0A380BCW7_SPOPA|nr:competence protein ComK [Sporosarcina pasteurii]MDS9472194.1 competence protein ComK [Sporosarcina pasteurii]SUI99224.1 Genetic competence transcription factor [Sporosarcina pasteurii]
MEILSEFVLRYETILFHPQYDEFGNLMTVVIGNQEPLLVDMPPSKLINYNLNYYGSSLEGANAGAKAVLGKIKRCPIVVNETLGIYWFPTKSPNKEDCVWIALHHVKEYTGLEKGKTMVVFTNGRSIVFDISIYSFNQRVQRAYELKGKIESRTKALEYLTVDQQQLLYLNEKRREYAFEMNSVNLGKRMEFNMRV